ncbi:hypothetical protein OG930_34125 [Streptomyces sp. NBC_01799]|uniref:hypothetical protein n=1 Tax=Streptomyces sp. NBC_01800 TaxID=2975945 RepID=UPI002DDACCD6|nr:hypothetical protein [Streptomyces sp. NBC_01800]WSA71736.1 hypothetical protein OIE65_34955 [Streptomyces sp. NBC_01800]WSA80217.1 hypothetical protein OG930_34125 [Streptomyces sp. NBC_01799]
MGHSVALRGTQAHAIAYGVLHLASDKPRFVTVTELVVDGGCAAVRTATPDCVMILAVHPWVGRRPERAV